LSIFSITSSPSRGVNKLAAIIIITEALTHILSDTTCRSADHLRLLRQLGELLHHLCHVFTAATDFVLHFCELLLELV